MNVCPTCHETFGAHLTVCPRDGTLLEGAATQGDRLVGRLLSGRYQVHERVGSGGFGTVYRVTDTHFDDVEALKVFDRKRFDARESEEAMERFAREAKLLRRLGKQTPHIVSVTNFVKDDEAGLFYFTMEYVEGNNLAQILVREGPLELWRAVGFLRQLCEALTIAQSHDPPVVHRDLKLENLMVTADGEEEELRVLDFGIAKIIGHGSLTSLQLGPGTPGYAAPEQVDRPTQVDHRADLFAMGVAFYGMLTAREPWTGGVITEPSSDAWSLLKAAKEEDPIPLRRMRDALPEPVESIIGKLLQKRPEDRFQSALEVTRSLDALEALYRDAAAASRRGAPTMPALLVPVPKEPTDQTDPVPALPVITGLRIKGVTSVTVQAGSSRNASVSARSFTPVLQAVASAVGVGDDLAVGWSAVSGASQYEVEWSTSPGFGNAQSQTTTSTSFTITFDETGSYYVRVRAINRFGSRSRVSSGEASTTVLEPLVITTELLPTGFIGAAYVGPLEASGGDGSYAWSVLGGELPAGLELSGADLSGIARRGRLIFTV